MVSENHSHRILIVEDEENARKGYEALLQRWNYHVLGVGTGRRRSREIPGIFSRCGFGGCRTSGNERVGTSRPLEGGDSEGPGDYYHRPRQRRTGGASDRGRRLLVYREAAQALGFAGSAHKSVELRENKQKVAALTRDLRGAGKLGALVGSSGGMQDVMRQIETSAPSTASVLITGETGSGKEIVARSIHMLSPRSERPFVAINCSAIPESLMESEIFGHEKGAFTGAAERRIGCFELAHGGTLLLDEIGEMPPQTQAKLLRVLEDRKVRRLGSKVETPVDVRVLAATNKNPEQAVADGHLRQDLYFRLNVFHIHLPPLREHKADLPALVEHLLADISEKHGKKVTGVSSDVMDLFKSYPWPGNVRELRNVLERSAIASDRSIINRQHLPSDFGHAPAVAASGLGSLRFPIGTTVDDAERELIFQTLAATSQNKTRAAELLGISLKTLHNKLKEYEAGRKDASQPEN